MASARQLVVGFADQAGVPRGFMAVSRSEEECAFDANEQALVLACRAEAERALAPFAVAPDWDRPVDEILEALTMALPTPALLIGESGRVLWMNREAELRLECVGLRFASERFYATTGTALAELVALAASEAACPGALLAAKTRETSPAWLAPGEAILARRLTLRGAAPCVLVCLHAPTGPREVGSSTARRVQALTVREDEVARLAADGYTVVAIAHLLNIAETTVSSHLKRVYRKLERLLPSGARGVASLARRALSRHSVPLGPTSDHHLFRGWCERCALCDVEPFIPMSGTAPVSSRVARHLQHQRKTLCA